MTPTILYAWGFYYFAFRFDFKRIKATWINGLKGFGLMLCGKIIDVFLAFLGRGDVSTDKVDKFIGTPLLIFSIIKIAKLLNEREERKRNNSITDEKNSP